MIVEQLRNEVLLGDLHLLRLGVARKTNDFHTIAERRRNRVEDVRGTHEQRMREIVGNLQVAIDERVILFRIQHLQQRGCRIPAVILPDLVDLIDHDQRVVHADLDVALDQLSGHRADVRLAMAANLRLVRHAAYCHTHELAA